MLKHITTENFEQEILNSEKVTLVDFFATWCGPCQMLGPVLEEIAKENEKFDIAKVDIDESRELAYKYGIEVVPTLKIFKQGKIVDEIEGLISKSELLEKINNQLN